MMDMKATQWSFQRIEEKYLLSLEQYDRLRNVLQYLIEPDDYPSSTICNIYYDTQDYSLIRKSMEKPVYKEKFRLRSYGVPRENSPVFMEIKKKFNGIVYKRRVQTDECSATKYLAGGELPEVNDQQILNEIEWFRHNYKIMPRVFLAYDRLAFKAVSDPELRITFDRNIRYRTTDLDLTKGDYGAPLLFNNEVLMEIKIPGAAPVWLSSVLSELEIFPVSFSKYGMSYKQLMEQEDEEIMEVIHCA